MNEPILRSWWVFALRGVIAILFAVMAVTWPGLTLLALTALFAACRAVVGTNPFMNPLIPCSRAMIAEP